jgi:hypothetical protein
MCSNLQAQNSDLRQKHQLVKVMQHVVSEEETCSAGNVSWTWSYPFALFWSCRTGRISSRPSVAADSHGASPRWYEYHERAAISIYVHGTSSAFTD